MGKMSRIGVVCVAAITGALLLAGCDGDDETASVAVTLNEQ